MFRLLHDPEYLEDTRTPVCRIPIIGWQISYCRQVRNEMHLVNQVKERGPVPESAWEGLDYDRAIRAKLTQVVIDNAYPPDATFHPDDRFELMIVFRYGDLNEVEIMMDIENEYGIEFNDGLIEQLLEGMTFYEFIRHVEKNRRSKRSRGSSRWFTWRA